MSKTVWLITGAGHGIGTGIAKAALAAGHAVVATGRDPERVAAAIGTHDLPVMRQQRSDLVIAITSTGGIVGQEFCSAYSASKFGLEGWIAPEVAPFGIHTMVVEPGFFRTDLLTPESTTYAEPLIEDYAQRTTQTVANWTSMNGRHGGDPAKLADALIKLVSQDGPPVPWVAGADAVQTRKQGPGLDRAGLRLPRPLILTRP